MEVTLVLAQPRSLAAPARPLALAQVPAQVPAPLLPVFLLAPLPAPLPA